mgnify:FL=1
MSQLRLIVKKFIVNNDNIQYELYSIVDALDEIVRSSHIKKKVQLIHFRLSAPGS